MTKIPQRCGQCGMYNRPGRFCSVLPLAHLTDLASSSSGRVLQAKQTIAPSLVDEEPVLLITDGIVGVRRIDAEGRGTIAAFFVSGDVVDLRGAPSSMRSNLCALSETRLCAIPRERFEDIIAACTSAREIAWQSLQSQSYRVIEHSAGLSKKRAVEKLAWFICEFRQLHENGDRSHSGPVFRIPFKSIDLAEYLGIQPETISRSFRNLEKTGAVSILRSNLIHILDPDRLVAIASGLGGGEQQRLNKCAPKVLRVAT